MNENTNGTELAKVLWYYGLISTVGSDEQKIPCPFHNDINPSMKVDLVSGSYFCFACRATGDAKRFVYNIEHNKDSSVNELNALRKFYKILKSKKTEHIDMSNRIRKPKDLNLKLLEAEDYYFNLSKIDWAKKPEDEEIKNAALYMKKRGFSFKSLTKCGCKYTYNKNYPLVFPMFDNEDFKGWVCRTTNEYTEKQRKYLYNEGFSRRNTLCGEYMLDKKNPVYIVEGYMDRLKLKMFGVKYAVAILGWKITDEQIQKLKKKRINHVISALDNDTCGKKGTEYLRNFFNVTRFDFDEDVKDPGEMTKKMFDKMNMSTIKKYNKEERIK